jgi:glycosyltransferase involved in cell wall biosynthesis
LGVKNRQSGFRFIMQNLRKGLHNQTISIVVPTYNRAKTIERCLRSIVNQTVKLSTEVIIVDDGNDNTCKIVAEFRKANKGIKINYVSPKVKFGLSKARNYGLEVSKGDCVICLDSDNELCLNAFKDINDTFKKHPAIDVAFFGSKLRSNKTPQNVGKLPEGSITYHEFLKRLPIVEYIPVISKKIIKKGYRFDESIWGFEGVLWLKILRDKSFVVVCNVVVQIYDDEGSDRLCVISEKQAANRVSGILKLLNLFGNDICFHNNRYYKRQVQNLVAYYMISDQLARDIHLRVVSVVNHSGLITATLALLFPPMIFRYCFPIAVWFRRKF